GRLAIKVKAPLRCEQLGISRDRVLKRFDDWADTAVRHQLLISNGVLMRDQFVEVPATDLRIKANIELAKITGCYQGGQVGNGTGPQTGGITIRLELPAGSDETAIPAIIANRRKGSGQLGVGPAVRDAFTIADCSFVRIPQALIGTQRRRAFRGYAAESAA